MLRNGEIQSLKKRGALWSWSCTVSFYWHYYNSLPGDQRYYSRVSIILCALKATKHTLSGLNSPSRVQANKVWPV